MAATATAQSFDPHSAASSLRQNQVAAERSRPGILTRIGKSATRNVRGAMLGISLMADSPFSRGEQLEDIEGDETELSGGGGGYSDGNTYATSPGDQARFAEETRRYQIQNATRRDVLPQAPMELDTETENEILQQVERSIVQQSQAGDVSQQGPARGLRQQAADAVAKRAAEKIKKTAQEQIARYTAQAADDLGETLLETGELVVGEEDVGLLAWVGTGYDLGRVYESLQPDPVDVGDSAASTASYTAQKTIRTLVPPYRFIGSGAGITDYIDDAKLIAQMFIPAMAIIVVVFVISVLCIMAYGVGSFAGLFPVPTS